MEEGQKQEVDVDEDEDEDLEEGGYDKEEGCGGE